MSKCDFDVLSLAVIKFYATDALSSMTNTGLDTTPLGYDIPCLTAETDLNHSSSHRNGAEFRSSDLPEVLAVLSGRASRVRSRKFLERIRYLKFLEHRQRTHTVGERTIEIGRASSHFEVNRIGLPCRKAANDGRLQYCIAHSFSFRVLYRPCLQRHPVPLLCTI